jgi:phosphatidate cytidylyltransferase
LLKRIVTALALIPVVLLLVLRVPMPVLALVTGAIAVAAVFEFLKLAQAYGVRTFQAATYGFVALLFLVLTLEQVTANTLLSTALYIYSLAAASMLAAFLFLTLGMLRRDLHEGYPAAAASVFAFVYIAMPLASLVQIRQHTGGAILVIYLLLVVWAGDIFAYFVGKAIGRHLMAPRISPKKTWEGAAASVAASVLIGAVFYNHATGVSSVLLRAHLIGPRDGMFGLEPPDWFTIIGLSIVLNIAAQLGDLVESLIKRGVNVKDSGSILPGHGGILDRIDALLFAAPVMWCWVAWRALS